MLIFNFKFKLRFPKIHRRRLIVRIIRDTADEALTWVKFRRFVLSQNVKCLFLSVGYTSLVIIFHSAGPDQTVVAAPTSAGSTAPQKEKLRLDRFCSYFMERWSSYLEFCVEQHRLFMPTLPIPREKEHCCCCFCGAVLDARGNIEFWYLQI